MAQLHALPENLPELVHIAAGGQRDVRQIEGHDTLIETAVVLMLARLVIAGIGDIAHARIGEAVGRQEGAAAHTDVHIALQLQHFLLGDIVGNQALGRTLGGQSGQIPVGCAFPDIVLFQNVDQLGERRCDPDALFVLDAFIALTQGLLDDHGQILLLLLISGLVQIHEHGNEGCLSVGGHEGNHLILDGLNTAADFVAQPVLHHLADGFFRYLDAENFHFLFHGFADLIAADLHKGCQVGQADGLTAILVGCHLGDDLRGDIAGGGEGMGLLDHGAGDDGAVLQHIVQIHQVAVVHMLGKVVGVMEMDNALIVRIHDLLGQQNAVGNILGHLTCHIVTLHGIDGGVLIGVLLLDFLVVGFNQAQDAVVRGV